MKTIKTIFTVLNFLLVSNTLVAMDGYFKGDTIRYKFDKMLVEVASTGFVTKSPEKSSMGNRVEQVQKILSEITITTPDNNEMITIAFGDQGEDMQVWDYKEIDLSYSKKNVKNLVVFDDGTIFEKEYGRYCLFFSFRAMEMKIYVENLNDLDYFTSDSFVEKVQQGTDAIVSKVGAGYKKTPVIAWVDLRNDEAKVYTQHSKYRSLDMLLISGGIGSGWVKNTFVSDINFRLGLGFSREGMMKNIYAIDWDMVYDFSESNENKFFELNHFVSAGWEHNFSNSPLEDKWYGFSLGYLVNRNNDFYKENTFRISVKKKINDTINLRPELYFNDFFNNVYPGIRFSVNF